MKQLKFNSAMIGFVFITWLTNAYALTIPNIQSCPNPNDYVSNKPVLFGSYDPVALMPIGAISDCTSVTGNAPCAEHRVFLPGPATTLRFPLFVFLPGSSMEPDKHELVLKMAAYTGYRTIGLSYDSRNNVSDICGTPNCGDNCQGLARDEILLGTDSSNHFIVQPADSVLERLYYLLDGLYNEDLADGVNDYSWNSYYVPLNPGSPLTVANIEWNSIIIAGFSQGAGNAAKLTKLQPVHGTVMLDGPGDSCIDPSGATIAADWLIDPVDASAGRPRYGVSHEHGISPWVAPITWQAMGIGLSSFDNLDYIYRIPPTNVAYTAQSPVTAMPINLNIPCSEHLSMAADECMPKEVTGGISAKSPAKTHLFRPYLYRFCYACDKATCP